MTTNKDTFCILPWIHLHSWPNGKVFPCCISSSDDPVGDLTKETIAEVINGDKLKQIRLDMINGKEISNCKKCYDVEQYKGSSWRTSFNGEYKEIIPDSIVNTQLDGSIEPNLLYLDFRFSNFCNLGCKTCGGDLSSTIASTPGREIDANTKRNYEAKGILSNAGIISYSLVKPNFITDDLQQYIEKIKCFYFAGGEPLIQKEHYEILKNLYDNKWFDKELRYSTNLSTLQYKGTDFLELWDNFDKVWLMCSIDHFGEKLEYLRQGVNSDKLYQNFERVLQHKNYKVSISLVVSIYNIYYLYDFFEFLHNNNYIDQITSIEVLYAFGDQVSPAILPEKYKTELLEKLIEDKNSDLYKILYNKLGEFFKASIDGIEHYVSNRVDDNNYAFNYFIQMTESFDKTYGQSFYNTFPWLGKCVIDYKATNGQ
jgi:sulfatase maturation enzyme AslB (radical SAM superfamily)